MVDIAFDDAAVFQDTLRLEEVEAVRDVLRRHRRPVRECHIVAQIEGHEGKVRGVFECRAEKAVDAVGVIGRCGQDAFAADRVQRCRHAVAGILVEAVEPALRPDGDFAALGRLGVYVVEMGEISRIFQRAEVRIAVRDGESLLRADHPGEAEPEPCRQAERGKMRRDPRRRHCVDGAACRRGCNRLSRHRSLPAQAQPRPS